MLRMSCLSERENAVREGRRRSGRVLGTIFRTSLLARSCDGDIPRECHVSIPPLHAFKSFSNFMPRKERGRDEPK